MDSIWSTTSSLRERSRLPGDRETQVAVIGGGMAGILIAHTLQAAGLRVAVLEAGRIGSGQSQHTTAKVTAQHGMCYDRLIRKLGAQKARQYAQANLAACKALDDLITTRGIVCDWQQERAGRMHQSGPRAGPGEPLPGLPGPERQDRPHRHRRFAAASHSQCLGW